MHRPIGRKRTISFSHRLCHYHQAQHGHPYGHLHCNLSLWLLAIECEAHKLAIPQSIHNAKFELDGIQLHAVTALTSAIISSLTEDTAAIIITTAVRIRPALITLRVRERFSTHCAGHYQALEMQADQTTLPQYEDLQKLFSALERLHTQMINAQFSEL